ncbi:hypothetical protein DFH06DRAFT_1042976 [Mycena polygramma]|nr:hypothetical protein DFH06DRAFT_1042976 [Mycena polygramma]
MFRTRSQLPAGGPSAARPIYVNDYSLYAETSSDHDLLLRGPPAAGHGTRWINTNLRGGTPPTHVPTIAFDLASGPPEDKTERLQRNLDGWTAKNELNDTFTLNELEEFESTDLAFLNLGNTAKRSQSEGSFEEPSSKRRKLDLASLRNVIPQPHVLPSMTIAAAKKSSVAPYSRHTPIPISPHKLPLPNPPPYTRRSWVIPVRGPLPWRHATSAVVLSDSSDLPQPPDPDTHEEIAWTTPALSSLWEFLTMLRDRSVAGPLGLSFHVSPNVSSNSQPTYSELSGMGAQPFTPDFGAAVSMVSSSRQVVIPLTFIDHIKVYHDAAISMQLRTLLDAWAFELGELKIRLLKDSRLVLLDERSKGIIVL